MKTNNCSSNQFGLAFILLSVLSQLQTGSAQDAAILSQRRIIREFGNRPGKCPEGFIEDTDGQVTTKIRCRTACPTGFGQAKEECVPPGLPFTPHTRTIQSDSCDEKTESALQLREMKACQALCPSGYRLASSGGCEYVSGQSVPLPFARIALGRLCKQGGKGIKVTPRLAICPQTSCLSGFQLAINAGATEARCVQTTTQ